MEGDICSFLYATLHHGLIHYRTVILFIRILFRYQCGGTLGETIMFGLFKKDPRKKLQTQYEKLLYDAMVLQRSGDIMGYSTVTEQANAVLDQIVLLDAGEQL